jgi:hypothetical protein
LPSTNNTGKNIHKDRVKQFNRDLQMPKLKGKLTFRQFLEKKEYNLYRNFKDKPMFTIRKFLEWVDEWEEEKEKLTKKNNL